MNDILNKLGMHSDPTTNGMTVFVLGILFILSVYHLFLYFQNRQSVYLLYSSYTFLIFARHTFLGQGDFFDDLLSPYRPWFIESGIKDFSVWFYNCIYFIFIYEFLDMKKKKRRIFKFIWYSGVVLGILAVLVQTATFISGDRDIMTSWYTNMFIPVITAAAIFGIYTIIISGSPVRYYALFGSMALLITSLITSGVFDEVNLDLHTSENSRYNYFYLGVVLENFLFSLGLGQKQRLIMRERDEGQKVLIDKFKENELLKEELKSKLEQRVEVLSRESEEKELSRLKSEYEKQLTELRISSLRNQMNPHFIFNSLNSIKLYIIKEDTNNAVYYLNKFSKLIRRILDTTKETSITLEKELETAELYLNIENIRFDNQLNFELQVEDGINMNSIHVPPLILQPFIENSIWHGLSMKEGKKNIEIRVEKDTATHVTLTISDNGIGRKRAAEFKQKRLHKKDSIGMTLTKERMERFAAESGQDFTMDIVDMGTEEFPLGTSVILHIPIDEMKNKSHLHLSGEVPTDIDRQ